MRKISVSSLFWEATFISNIFSLNMADKEELIIFFIKFFQQTSVFPEYGLIEILHNFHCPNVFRPVH